MTPSQEQHLKDILEEVARRLNYKYRKGAEEHGGDIMDMTALELIDNSIDEGIDNMVYLLTLRNKIAKDSNQ